MFYNLPTDEPFMMGRHIRSEDLIDGLQEFYLLDMDNTDQLPGDDEKRMWPHRIVLRVNMLTMEEKDNITLKFATRNARDRGIALILFDLFGLGRDPRTVIEIPEEVRMEKKKERDNAEVNSGSGRENLHKSVPLGDARTAKKSH